MAGMRLVAAVARAAGISSLRASWPADGLRSWELLQIIQQHRQSLGMPLVGMGATVREDDVRGGPGGRHESRATH